MSGVHPGRAETSGNAQEIRARRGRQKAKFNFSSFSVNQRAFVYVYAFERECVRKFLENASKMNAECNTPATKRIFLPVFFFFFFLENCSVATATRLLRLFRYALQTLCRKYYCASGPRSITFLFSFFLFCAREHPEDRRQVCALATEPAASRLKQPVFVLHCHGFSYSGLLIVRRKR